MLEPTVSTHSTHYHNNVRKDNHSYDLYNPLQCNVCIVLNVTDDKEGKNSSRYGPTIKLSKCDGCQLALYCSREHQIIDWKLHRKLCRAMQRIMKSYNVSHPFLVSGQPQDTYSFERAILQVKLALRFHLKRPMRFYEEEQTSFPPHCAICYSFDGLQPCQLCYGAAYCSPEHAKQDYTKHFANCGLLQTYYAPFKLLKQPRPEAIVSRFSNIKPNMKDMDLIDIFEHITEIKMPQKPSNSLQDYQTFACVADFSCMGTICYTLSHCEMSSLNHDKFIIFIVGATIEEKLWFREIHTMLFFLQYPAIKRLELYFIGPEVAWTDRHELIYQFGGAERVIAYYGLREYFETFNKKYSIYPSLIVAFNCGFSERAEDPINATLNDTWAPAITEMLLTCECPIIFTSFTRLEADLDFSVVARVASTDRLQTKMEYILHICKNPYRDLRPLRNWQIQFGDEIFYRNGYVQAVITTIKK